MSSCFPTVLESAGRNEQQRFAQLDFELKELSSGLSSSWRQYVSPTRPNSVFGRLCLSTRIPYHSIYLDVDLHTLTSGARLEYYKVSPTHELLTYSNTVYCTSSARNHSAYRIRHAPH